jgi:hypothetical protein
MFRHALPVVLVAVGLCVGCGSSTGGSSERSKGATVRGVKLGMTQKQVTSLLGQPDEKNELYGLPERWVDWLWDTDNGRSSVTFNKRGRVTRVLDCPNAVCTVVASTD